MGSQELSSLQAGGLPYNVGGWLVALCLKLFARDTTSTMEYDKDHNKENWIADKEKISVRGERPLYGWHVVPATSRQSNQISTESMAMALDKFIQELVELNPAVVELVTQSPHERLNAGVMTNSAIHSVHGVTQAALLIERGWGERHQLSGSRGLHALPLPDSDAMKPARLPKEYIWIYAPRDVQELAVIKNILVAGVKYMTESKDIVVPQ